MNYNYDTEMDMRWEAEQGRRRKLLNTGLPDASIRRVTAGCFEATLSPNSRKTSAERLAGGSVTLGNAISALAINGRDSAHLAKVCREILGIVTDKNRLGLHAEFVDLKGLDAVVDLLHHHRGEVIVIALQILDKLSRTSARSIAACGALDVVVRICEIDGQAPRAIEAALRVLHGLSFDSDVKLLLLRHGVRELAEVMVESRLPARNANAVSIIPTEDQLDEAENAWQDVLTISTRLLTRMGGPRKGGTRRLAA